MSGFGEDGQLKLKRAKVLLVGVGGLGSVIAIYLTAAGVGNIGIIDNDIVSIHNLQRQILYNEKDINKPKIIQAKQHLNDLNNEVKIDIYNENFTEINAVKLIEQYDMVIDGTDNFKTRYIINDTCLKLDKPYIYAAVNEFEGQISVFNYLTKINLRTLFPDNVDNNEITGIIGTTTAIIGGVAANEAIKIITNVGEILDGKLWTINLKTMQTNIFNIK